MVDSAVSKDPSWKGGIDDPATRLLLDLKQRCVERNVADDIINDLHEIYGLINVSQFNFLKIVMVMGVKLKEIEVAV